MVSSSQAINQTSQPTTDTSGDIETLGSQNQKDIGAISELSFQVVGIELSILSCKFSSLDLCLSGYV